MKRSAKSEYQFVACVLYSTGSAGFALPVIRGPNNAWYMQEIDEVTNLVVGCRLLEGHLAEPMPLANPALVRLGTEAKLCFVDDGGVAHLGPLEDLRSIVVKYCLEHPTRLDLSLQLAFMSESAEDRRSALARISEAILASPHSDAIFECEALQRSALRMRLWDRLVESADNSDLAHRVLAVRAQLDVEVDPNGSISLNLSALSAEDLAKFDLPALRHEMQNEFGRDTFVFQRSHREHQRELFADDPSWQLPLSVLSRAGRQEERVAMLIDALLRDPGDGALLLKNYKKDRASFATQIIRMLERSVEDGAVSVTDIIQVIDRALITVFPRNRGDLFYYLAKHLAKYTEINTFLARRLGDYKNMYVGQVREAVSELLHEGPFSAGRPDNT
jgi:hypothetical protein